MADDAAFRDQRKSERVPAKVQVQFRELSEAAAEAYLGIEELPPLPASLAQVAPALGHTENLSQGGMSLTGELKHVGGHSLAKGKKLWLEFDLDGVGSPARAMAVVAWSLEGRGEGAKFTVGLMFLGISPADLEHIGRYVESRSTH